tara:strand:- start:233 stop:487 length:255 start_codon:yes stop_codon:yes gene_type:complete
MSKKQKLTEEQLNKVQELNQNFLKLKVQIADAEVNKAKAIEELNSTQEEFRVFEKTLMEEYGQNAVIDLRTGEVKPPEKEEKNG